MLGQVRQLCHPDACAHMGPVEPAGASMHVMVRKESCHINDNYCLQVVGKGGSVPHCNWVRRCVVDTAFHLA
jgi:hypothetical protein